jgi:hypothetical protein
VVLSLYDMKPVRVPPASQVVKDAAGRLRRSKKVVSSQHSVVSREESTNDEHDFMLATGY